jgi:hypothetical protein
MFYYPTCPNYTPCEYGCHLLDTPPPPYYPTTTKDAIQSTRVVQTFEQSARRYEKPSHHRYDRARRSDSSERHVHFAPRRHQHLIEGRKGTRVSPRPILVNTAVGDTYPTIYIVTFATDYIRNTPGNVQRLVASQIPRRGGGIVHLCTSNPL